LGFERHTIPVRNCYPPTLSQLREFVELMGRLPMESKVLVHREGGTGRTGTFAAAYWIATGRPAPDAIAHVRTLRPHAVETWEQEAVLEQCAREQHSSGSQALAGLDSHRLLTGAKSGRGQRPSAITQAPCASIAVFRAVYGRHGSLTLFRGSGRPSPRPLPEGEGE
jgi:hypothetical protein